MHKEVLSLTKHWRSDTDAQARPKLTVSVCIVTLEKLKRFSNRMGELRSGGLLVVLMIRLFGNNCTLMRSLF